MVVRQQYAGGGALALAVVLTGLLAGCAGGGALGTPVDAVPVPLAPDAPADAVHRAAARLVQAGTARTRTAMDMATGGTRVTIRGEGVYDFARRLGELRVVLPQDPTGASRQQPIVELLAPGALYMKNRGAGVPADKWVRVDTGSVADGNLVTGGATDPLAAAELLRGARGVRYVGGARLDGVPVRHYRGTTDLVRAAAVASGETRRVLAAAARGFSTSEVPFDAYLDEQGLVRKLRHRFSFVNERHARAVAVASTVVLSGFGAPVDVRLPDAADIYAGKIAEGA
ncbi:hypothetical protein ACWD6I_01285 [Streptomyces sp. NPDC002454]